jgi:hypothetical protein
MKVKYGVIFAVFGFIVFFAIEAQAVDWKLFGTDAEGNSRYYDPQSIKRVSKDIVQVWTKMVFKEKGEQFMIRKLGPEFKGLDSETVFYEFNCNEKKRRTLSLTFYKKDGSVLNNSGNTSSWSFIVPESVLESLFNIVCGGNH